MSTVAGSLTLKEAKSGMEKEAVRDRIGTDQLLRDLEGREAESLAEAQKGDGMEQQIRG
jgi:hypothetical protein